MQGYLELATLDHAQTAFEYFQDWRLHISKDGDRQFTAFQNRLLIVSA